MPDYKELMPGLTRESFHDGRIAVWSATTSTKEVIQAWFDYSRQEMQDWPAEHQYLALLDMSRVILTPFGREKAAELTEVRPDLGGRVAIVISASSIGHLTRLFVNRSLNKNRERRVFYSREEAIQWLEEAL